MVSVHLGIVDSFWMAELQRVLRRSRPQVADLQKAIITESDNQALRAFELLHIDENGSRCRRRPHQLNILEHQHRPGEKTEQVTKTRGVLRPSNLADIPSLA